MDGLFKAELHTFFMLALTDSGYSGFDLFVTYSRQDIVIKVTNNKALTDNNSRKIHELEAMIVKRFDLKPESIQIKFQKLRSKGLCAAGLAESIKTKLLKQIPVRNAVSFAIRQAVEPMGKDRAVAAKGCEIIISGKLSQQRAKSMKFKKGYMISSGHAKDVYLETAIRHVFLKQGVMGIKVKIMKDYNPDHAQCAKEPLPDFVNFLEVKKEPLEEERIINRATGVDTAWFL